MTSMTVKLKNTKGGGITEVELDVAGTIGDLKEVVQRATTIAPALQRLIYKGKLLKNDAEALEPLHFAPGDTILYMRMNAPAQAQASAPRPQAQAQAQAQAPAPARAQAPQAAAMPPRMVVPPSERTAFTEALAILGVGTAARAEALRTLGKVMDNITGHPHEAKYRTLKKGNAVFQRRLGNVPGADACLRALGFRDAGETWELTPSAEAWELITAARSHLRQVAAFEAAPRGNAAAAAMPGGFGGLGGFPAMPGMGFGGMGGAGPPPGMDVNAMMNMLGDPTIRNRMLEGNPLVARMPPAQRAQLDAILNDPAALRQTMDMMDNPGMRQMMEHMMRNPGAMGAMGGMGGMGGMPPFGNAGAMPFMGANPAAAGGGGVAGAPGANVDFGSMINMLQGMQQPPGANAGAAPARPAGNPGTATGAAPGETPTATAPSTTPSPAPATATGAAPEGTTPAAEAQAASATDNPSSNAENTGDANTDGDGTQPGAES